MTLAVVPGGGGGVGAANAVPGDASTVTAQTTVTAAVSNPRLPVRMTHTPVD